MYNEEISGIETLLGVDDDSNLLHGLGATSDGAKKAARKYAGIKMKMALKERILSREQKFILSNLDLLDEDSRKAISENRMQFFDFDLYVRVNLNSGGEILNTATKKDIGVSMINSNILPKFTNLAIGYVRVAIANHATQTTPATQTYSNTGAISAAIANGELLIKLTDKPIIELPMAKFFNNSSAAVPNRIQQAESDFIKLDAPKLIPSETTFSIEWKQAVGSTMPSNQNFFEVRIAGSGTRLK